MLAKGAPEIPRADVRLKAPITNPEKVICIGMNYVDHCTEQNVPVPKEPVIFSKFASAITDPGSPVSLEETEVQNLAIASCQLFTRKLLCRI